MSESSEIPFTRDQLRLSETKSKLDSLQPGEALVISHTATIFNVDGVTISVDVGSLQGKPFILDREFIQSPSLQDALNIKRPEYPVKLFANQSTNEVGKKMGAKTAVQLTSHLDTDHFDLKMTIAMADSNPNQAIYLPPESIPIIKEKNPDLPEQIINRMHETSPNSKIELKGETGQVSITPFDVPHQGDPRIVKSVQGFVINGGGQRILYIPDSGFSPELVNFVSQSHWEQPFTQLFVSTAKYQPESMYKILDPNKAKSFRENFEEQISHSAIISLALAEITGLKANILHQGFYHKSNREADLTYRLPATDNLPNTEAFSGTPEEYQQQWHDLFMDKVSRAEHRVDVRQNQLGEELLPLPGKQNMESGDIRFRFARHVRRWLNLFPIPKSRLDNLHMPGPNEVIPAN